MNQMKERKFGVEVEVVLPHHKARGAQDARAKCARVVAAVLGDTSSPWGSTSVKDAQGRVWQVVSDGSLSGGYPCELVTPPLNYENIELLQKVVRALKTAGFQANASCGIHVHVDANDLGPKAIVNLIKMMNSKQELIMNAVGTLASRRAYCKPIKEEIVKAISKAETLARIGRAWFDTKDWQSQAHYKYNRKRYHALNLNSIWIHGTVEFRLYNGTLHAGEIKSDIHLSLAMVEKARSAKAIVVKKLKTQNPKYNMRVFLNNLGLIGKEFKTVRQHMTKRLAGNSAWRTQEQAINARVAA